MQIRSPAGRSTVLQSTVFNLYGIAWAHRGWFEGGRVSTSRVSPPGPLSLSTVRREGVPLTQQRSRKAAVWTLLPPPPPTGTQGLAHVGQGGDTRTFAARCR